MCIHVFDTWYVTYTYIYIYMYTGSDISGVFLALQGISASALNKVKRTIFS